MNTRLEHFPRFWLVVNDSHPKRPPSSNGSINDFLWRPPNHSLMASIEFNIFGNLLYSTEFVHVLSHYILLEGPSFYPQTHLDNWTGPKDREDENFQGRKQTIESTHIFFLFIERNCLWAVLCSRRPQDITLRNGLPNKVERSLFDEVEFQIL